MTPEVEIKLRLNNPAKMRQQLAAHDAQGLGAVLETNRIYDTTDGRLYAADCGLRLRTTKPLDPAAASRDAPPLLTYKGPRQASDLKTRNEVETPVQDANAMHAILTALGFREAIVFEKRRETHSLAGCLITLDELPRLGWFVEIEAPEATAVHAARRQLGLEGDVAIDETYVHLAAVHGAVDAQGVHRLTFPAPD